MPEGSEAVWVEKYRPHSLADMVGQEGIVPLLQAYAAKRTLPHLLFAGPPGDGEDDRGARPRPRPLRG